MTFKLVLVTLCMIWLFLQDRTILSDSVIKLYTMEGSMTNLTFNVINPRILFSLDGSTYTAENAPRRFETNTYDIVLRPKIFNVQLINVTASDIGYYWLDYWNIISKSELTITNKTCPASLIERVCAIVGSSAKVTFIFNLIVYHSTDKLHFYKKRNSRRVTNTTIKADLNMYNVTFEDEGFYQLELEICRENQLQVANLYFINQTDQSTLVGLEGKAMTIKCSSATPQYITALQIKSNGSILAVGDNQSVGFSFIPTLTNHLAIYTCEDVAHSSIRIEVTLIIGYLRFINQTDQNTLVGQERKAMKIQCSYETAQHTTVLKIESNGSILAMGYKRSLSYSFIPKRTDHLTTYTCIDTSHPSIMTEIKLLIMCFPIFAKENRNVQIGKVGQSITLRFLVYSYPDIKEILLGSTHSSKRKLTTFNVLNTTLLYTESEIKVGIQGYEISIESQKLNLDDFQAYSIIAKNRRGSSDYHFEIIKKEDIATTKRKRTHLLILYVVSAILSCYIIVFHVYLCVKRKQTWSQGDHGVPANHNYHTYDEIGTISYNTASNVLSSNINENNVPNQAFTRAPNMSHRGNMHSTDDNTFEDVEVHAYLDIIDLPQSDVEEVHELTIANYSISTYTDIDDSGILSTLTQKTSNTTNTIEDHANTNEEPSSDQKLQTTNDSNSVSSGNSLIGSVGDGYENPYEFISHERQESHQYIGIIRGRHCSVSSTETNCDEQTIERSLTNEASYVNLQL